MLLDARRLMRSRPHSAYHGAPRIATQLDAVVSARPCHDINSPKVTLYDSAMLKHLRVKRFRCFENFAIDFSPKQLVFGANGVGKTSLLDVLDLLRRFTVGGSPASTVFSPDTFPRQFSNDEKAREQKFILGASVAGAEFRYELVVRFVGRTWDAIVQKEQLSLNGAKLLDARPDAVKLCGEDDRAPEQVDPLLVQNRSAVGIFREGQRFQRIADFANWLEATLCVQIDPRRMRAESEGEERRLSRDAANFAAWFRQWSQEDPAAVAKLHDVLKDAIPGLSRLKTTPLGARRAVLEALFAPGSQSPQAAAFAFHELSDGQRALTVLYALLSIVRTGATLVIDEPDNFIALPEIQPWLYALSDAVDEHAGQAILISHHPELLNQWAADFGAKLLRDESGAVRTERYKRVPGSDLSPAEEIARGWELA